MLFHFNLSHAVIWSSACYELYIRTTAWSPHNKLSYIVRHLLYMKRLVVSRWRRVILSKEQRASASAPHRQFWVANGVVGSSEVWRQLLVPERCLATTSSSFPTRTVSLATNAPDRWTCNIQGYQNIVFSKWLKFKRNPNRIISPWVY